MEKIKKKDQLILSATELFNEQGYNATGIDQIVEHANVATMTLYRNFNSKEKLIESVLRERERLYFRYLFDNEELAIENVVIRHLNWLEQYHSNGCLFLRANEEYQNKNEQIARIVKQHKIQLLNKLNFILKCEKISFKVLIVLEGSTSMAEYIDMDTVRKTTLGLIKGVIEDV
ncbi:TetR/AcrR family transcriptional regulator [Macrococcoides canis]|uniref:TetR/AcrR family transcriptional regulator n=1 Tax=Macrococcoides canis TaxID=1855823 RepID=UPI001F424418|nr:TetR/AcrR family transcriptional regulator [Macrococcus canis]MCO4097483.1 TetR/AcrR family transcriptional regulator [Macrococcus canis]UJS29020.1 TetR/AcrR family transcriptional regulator [Macrococcus canis]UTH06465.1 TetR/AcrR family transcriptional regulator [Macrococcus canis]